MNRNLVAKLRAMGTSNLEPDLEQMDSLLLSAADEIEKGRAVLKIAQQAILEFSTAQERGPQWYTRGKDGMYRQVELWLQRGLEAVREALGSYDESGQYLKEIPPFMRVHADGRAEPALPRLEYNPHCGECQRNKITMEVFAPSARSVDSAKPVANDFGMVPLKEEGAPVHPDTFLFEGTDEAYLARLQAYADHFGKEEALSVTSSRPELLEKLK